MTNEKSKTLNESIISIRVKLQNSKLKKSGKNSYANFDYFELADFLPKLNELMLEENINDIFYIKDNYAVLELLKDGDKNTYTIPFERFSTPLNKGGLPCMQDIQYLGALNTYYKRYLYLNAFGITDGDVIDGLDNRELNGTDNKQKEVEQLATPRQLEILQRYYQKENLEKLLKLNKIDKLENLPLKKASELIAKLKGNENK